MTIDRAAILCPRNSISPQPSPPFGAFPNPLFPKEKERLSLRLNPSLSLLTSGFTISGSGSARLPASHLAASFRFFAMLCPYEAAFLHCSLCFSSRAFSFGPAAWAVKKGFGGRTAR